MSSTNKKDLQSSRILKKALCLPRIGFRVLEYKVKHQLFIEKFRQQRPKTLPNILRLSRQENQV